MLNIYEQYNCFRCKIYTQCGRARKPDAVNDQFIYLVLSTLENGVQGKAPI